MSDPNPSDPSRAPDAPAGGSGFELPLPDEDAQQVKLRRRLFGFNPDDVKTELQTRADEIAELRRDMAALWLAFGQHERTIKELLAAIRVISNVEIDPPGGRSDQLRSPGYRPQDYGFTVQPPAAETPRPQPAPAPAPQAAPTPPPQSPPQATPRTPSASSGDPIGEQLGDLDQVLAAIENATNSLQRTYAEQIAAHEKEPVPDAGDEDDPVSAGADESPGGEDEDR